MTTLHDLIQSAYPGADALRDYIIQDDSDGRGPYLAAWHIDGPVPEGITMGNTPVSRWADGCQGALTQASGLIKGVLALSIYTRFVQEAVTATEPGAIVPGTQWTKEQAEQILLLWQQTMAWLSEPLVEGDVDTRLDVVSRNA